MSRLQSNVISLWNGFRARVGAHLRSERELDHRSAFSAFYDSLRLYADPIYVFFTGDLLHWVTKAVEFVPPDVSLVLIGSGLTPEEEVYIHTYVKRPFHAIRQRVSDQTVWEWLFDINHTNFGWLDADCLVLNPQLFDEMKRLPDDVAMNGCWLTYQGWTFLTTYFLFINHCVLADMKVRVPGISPKVGFPLWKLNSCLGPMTTLHLFFRGEAKPLKGPDLALVRQTGVQKRVFDTTMFYQAACLASGYKLGAIRELNNDWNYNAFCSEELLHMSGVSWYRKRYLSQEIIAPDHLVIRAVLDYLLLDAADPKLPPNYADLKELIRRMLGGNPRALRKHVHRFLLTTGFTEQTFSKPGLEFLDYDSSNLRGNSLMAAETGVGGIR